MIQMKILSRVLIDETGTDALAYDEFGVALVQAGQTQRFNQPFGFTGYQSDNISGLYYAQARFYDPATSRMISEDIYWKTRDVADTMILGNNPQKVNGRKNLLGEDIYTLMPDITATLQSNNLYNYSINSPVRYTDPSGLKVRIVCREFAAQMGIRVNVGEGIIWDDKGNIGIVDTASFGGGTIGASVGGFYAEIDAPTIYDIQGGSIEAGISGGPGIYGGFDLTITTGMENYYGYILAAGYGVGLFAEIHAQLTFSDIKSEPLKIALRILLGRNYNIIMPILEFWGKRDCPT